MQRFVIFCHPLIQVCPFFFSYQHCRLNDKSQAPHISFVTHWVHVPATGAPLRAHLRLEQHPLASCINSMTHHASLWQAPPLLGCPRSLFNLRASKWSELTHYFPTKKKKERACRIVRAPNGKATSDPFLSDPLWVGQLPRLSCCQGTSLFGLLKSILTTRPLVFFGWIWFYIIWEIYWKHYKEGCFHLLIPKGFLLSLI